jgi:hypothetical protein
MAIIKKKSWPGEFQKILDGKKKFDLRLGDTNYKEGDILVLEEFDPKLGKYTGRKIQKKIGFVLKTKDMKFWSKEVMDKYGFVVMSLENVHN